MKLRILFHKAINLLIPKSKNKVYVVPHNNGRTDKYDLINYSADNALSLLNYAKNKSINLKKCVFYVECYSEKRMDILNKYVSSWKIKVVPVICEQTSENPNVNKRIRIKNRLLRYSCKTWVSCTPFANFSDKLKRQIFVCLSYSTPLKSDILSYSQNYSYIDYFLETSFLTACVHSAEYHNYINSSFILGFPRNDNLFTTERQMPLREWINKKINFDADRIIVYAPTYRDYQNAFLNCNALGYEDKDDVLETFLKKNKILLIVKYHPLQDCENIRFTPHVLLYEKSFDYTLYDLLAISDMLISDYSSVIHDYIITSKPIILNLFDYSRYQETRGFAFEPLDYVMPTSLCCNLNEVICEITKSINQEYSSSKYLEVQNMFHKNIDSNSSERVWNFLIDLLGNVTK